MGASVIPDGPSMAFIPDVSYSKLYCPSPTPNTPTPSQVHLLQRPNQGPSHQALTLPDLHDDLHGARAAHTSLPVLQSLQAPIGCSCSKRPAPSGGEIGMPVLPRNPSAALASLRTELGGRWCQGAPTYL